jgi:hypothetical protein
MATRYQDISYGSFGGGMDQLSPESRIPDEYVESLDNMDPTPNGSLVKRTGTQLYGSLPVRVERIEYNRADTLAGGELCLYLDSSVDVLSLRSTPIYLYGRTSEGHASGDLTDTPRGIYYPSFTTDIRQPIYEASEVPPLSGNYEYTTTQVTLDGNTHDQGPFLALNVYRSTSNSALTSELIEGGIYSVNKETADVTVDVTTGLVDEDSTVAFDTFIVAKGRGNEPGTSYVYTGTINAAAQYNAYAAWLETGSPLPVVSPISTITINAATHNLNNFNILVDCYIDTGTDYERIVPDSYVITATGAVELNFAHWQDFSLVACLYSIPSSNTTAQLVETDELDETIVIQTPKNPFLYYQLFKENSDGSRTSIIGSRQGEDSPVGPNDPPPEDAARAMVVEAAVGSTDYETTFYITNRGAPSFTAIAYWDFGRLVSNKLCVEASDPSTDTFQFIVPGAEHRLGPIVSTCVVQSTNPTNDNNLLIGYDAVTTDVVTTDVAIDLTNNTGAGFSAYGMLADRSVASGAYNSPEFTIPIAAAPSYSTVIPISASGTGGHNKGAHVNVTAFRLVKTGTQITAYQEIPISNLVISSTGDVTATFVNDEYVFANAEDEVGTPVEWTGMLAIYPVADTLTAGSTIPYGTTGTLVIPGLTSSFAFIQVYYLDGTDRVRVVPDRLSVNSIQGTAIIQLTNNFTNEDIPPEGLALTLEARWDYSDYTVEESIPSTSDTGLGYLDANPQITIWGLPHKQLYSGATGSAPGYVTHVDTYRAQAEERAVAGLGGNLFAAYTYGEADTAYGLGEYFPNLRARVSDAVTIGPAFISTTDGPPTYSENSSYLSGKSVQYGNSYYESNKFVPAGITPDNIEYWTEIVLGRTQGVIRFRTASSNQAAVVTSSYISSNTVRYRLYTPNLTIVGSLSQVFNDREFLTVSGMGYAINNGEFQVVSASLVGTEYIDVTVINPALDTSDWNEASADGRAGIFTDRIPLEVTCPFFEGDRMLSASWGDEQFLIATGASAGNEVRIEGLWSNINVPDGLLLVGARTSRIIPLRSLNAIPTTSNLVAGDILSFTGLNRQLRAKFVNPRANEIVVILNNETTTSVLDKTVDIQVADSNYYQIGQRILLLNALQFTGEQIVTEIVSPQVIRIGGNPTLNEDIPGVIVVGHNVEVDEAFDWYDSLTSTVSFRTARRWLPIEEPGTAYLQFPPNRYRYFNSRAYDDQAFLRSTVVADTMYLTNGLDAVQRYDGSTITRAGLFRWQPNLYLTQDTTDPAIKLVLPSITSSDIKGLTGNVFKVSAGLERRFSVNESIRYTRTVSGQTELNEYTIKNIWVQGNDGFIEVNANGQGVTTGTDQLLERVGIYSYYYRLNMIDVNGNKVASAVTGAEDSRISLSANCSIRHLILRPPFLDNFDFARIEVQVYRTKIGSSAPFYLVSTLQPSWNMGGEAYLEFVDTASDFNLKSVDQDEINVTLLGQELGQTWTGPLRSKYVTSTSNSLVLANIKSWPTLSLAPVKSPQVDRLRLSDFENRKLLIRRNNLDAAVTTDNYNRMNFEFVHEEQIAINSAQFSIDYDTNALTIASVDAAPHGLSEGDWVYLFHYDVDLQKVYNVNPRLGGHYQVYTIESESAFTVRISNALLESISLSPLSTIDVNSFVSATEPSDVPVWIGQDRLYGSYANSLLDNSLYKVDLNGDTTITLVGVGESTVGIDIDSYVTGLNIPTGTRVVSIDSPTTFTVSQTTGTTNNVDATISTRFSIETYAFLRLANAINSAQAACEALNFTPWVVANAGGEYSGNQIVLETPYVSNDTLEVVLPAFGNTSIYANGVRVDAGAQVQTRSQLFPSRLMVSYPNYPEVFDAPLSFLDTDSDSAIDINPSDGQEITGVIPFFGESAFGAAQKDGILLVFKTASVYLVNIAAKRAGQNAVQRLDTRGLGCTAPYSIAPTQNGIMFANQSGIYRISRNLECQYIGRRMERVWKEKVDSSELDVTMHGHYYPLGNQYKLSVPYKQDELNHPARVLVYNTVREYTADGYRDGSWTSYSSQEAIGWANMLRQSLFATPHGEVFTLRMTGTSTDYRDDGVPIQARATLRALDFGSSSVRKMVSSFNLQFRPEDKDVDVTVEASIDLIDNWETLDPAVVSRQRTIANINNRAVQQLAIIQYMSNKRKGVFYQLRVSNGILDQGLQLNGVSLMVAGLGAEGIIQARETGTRK